jgi:hypothetical protein
VERNDAADCVVSCHLAKPPSLPNCKSTEISGVDYLAVYCSYEQPTVAQSTSNGWSVLHLSFDDAHDYHTVHWDNRLYFLICQNYDIGEGSNIVGFANIAKRFGYHPVVLTKLREDTTVKTIEEIAADDRIQ